MTSKRLFPLLALGLVATLAVGCTDDEETSSAEGGAVDGATEAAIDSSAEAGPLGDADASTAPDTSSTPDGGDASRTEAGEASNGDGGLSSLQARGRYLVDHVIACGDCHTPQGPNGPDLTKYLAGNPAFVKLPSGDALPSRNLTNDATGLANVTDSEIKAMFLDGKRPIATGGAALNPVMPYYVFYNMTASDADAIVAYLRTVPGVKNEIPRRSAAFDVPTPATPINMQTVPLPDNGYVNKEAALRGRYLSTQAGVCIECHTKHVDGPLPIDATKLFAGGEDFSALFAGTLMIHPVSKNLTSDVTTGLGNWTVDDVVNAVTKGKAKDGSGICPPMPTGPMGAFGGLTAQDATDIAHYIKSLPAISNLVPDMCAYPPASPSDGGADAAETDGAATDGATPDATSSDAGADSAAPDGAPE